MRVVVVDTVEELLLTRLELELLEALELSELEELIRLELELTELELELRELELIMLAAVLLVVITGGVDLVAPPPPPQAVKVKLRILAMKTGLINLIIVSGIQAAPLFIMLWAKSVTDSCKRLHFSI
jgi:hypothetical protein